MHAFRSPIRALVEPSGTVSQVRVRRVLPLLALLVLVALVAAELRLGYGRDWLEETLAEPDPLTEPADVAPPAGLTIPELEAPAPVAVAADDTAAPAPRAVRRAVAPALADADLGRHVGMLVAGLGGDDSGITQGDSGLFVPASTTKLLTTTAALSALGPDDTFTTSTVLAGRRLVLVGGGDPYLASRPTRPGQPAPYPPRADVTSLADLTAKGLRQRGVSRVSVGYDDSLFTGPTASPHWEPSYLPDQVVAPITALWVDGGRPSSGFGRVEDPSQYAAGIFADALRREGIRVRGAPAERPAPTGAEEVAAVTGASLDQVVEHVLDVSDNEAAEVLAHHVGLAVAGEGSFEGGRAGVAETLAGLGVDLTGERVYDGSGLSRRSRLQLGTLVDVLRVVASPEHAELRAVVSGLPVAGFTGSLELRFDEAAAPGAGVVRAKTGTLTGVSGLAGLVTDAEGRPLVFAAVADKVALVDTLDARDALDRVAAALATCRCTTR